MIRRKRWPHRFYHLGWTAAILSWTGAILIAMAREKLSALAKAGGIGLFILGLVLIAVLIVAWLDRKWPKRRYRMVCADENGVTAVSRGGKVGLKQTLNWESIDRIEVERKPLSMEVRLIGSGSDRSKSLKLNSLAWHGLDELVAEALSRSSARLVEGRRGRAGDDYF
jgi:hypothetical protein